MKHMQETNVPVGPNESSRPNDNSKPSNVQILVQAYHIRKNGFAMDTMIVFPFNIPPSVFDTPPVILHEETLNP